MKKLNKPRLLLCLSVSILLNGYWFLDNLAIHERLVRYGMTTPVYIKNATKESTFSQKIKHTKVGKFFFVTTEGDTIRGITKYIWDAGNYIPGYSNFPTSSDVYMPLDSAVYYEKNPGDYELLSEFRSYSPIYTGIEYLFNALFFTAGSYMLVHVIEKLFKKTKRSQSARNGDAFGNTRL